MRILATLIILCFGLNTWAEEITYECRGSDQKKTIINFDKSIMEGAKPREASVQLSIDGGQSYNWTTEMYLGLPIKNMNMIYVHFRHEGPWNQITLEVDSSLNTANASVFIKDANISLDNLSCIRR